MPTFAEYVPAVSAAVSDGTRRAYGSYWNRVMEHRGARRLDDGLIAEAIRHTILTWVERNSGYAVARAYVGHADSGSDVGATATYVRASLAEVAAALAALAGEPHPHTTTEGW